MKKAIVETGSKQYLVQVGDQLAVELLTEGEKEIVFRPLLLINGDAIEVGQPRLENGCREG